MERKPTSVNPTDERLIAFQRLLNIMDELREKCPWDKKQTLQSLRHLTIEETYELADAITQNDLNGIKGELGDLFLHLLFYSKIGSEMGAFDVTDVLNGICEKLVFRHPHIYSDVVAETEQEVKLNWEKLKLKEGKTSVLEGVPNALPALIKAMRIQEKVKGIGFDWDTIDQVRDKVIEEFEELHEAQKEADTDEMEQEMGDVLFSITNYARFIGINPEDALERTNRKFIQRFQLMETYVKEANQSFDTMNLSEMDVFWEKAKQAIRIEQGKKPFNQ